MEKIEILMVSLLNAADKPALEIKMKEEINKNE